MHCRCYQDDE